MSDIRVTVNERVDGPTGGMVFIAPAQGIDLAALRGKVIAAVGPGAVGGRWLVRGVEAIMPPLDELGLPVGPPSGDVGLLVAPVIAR